MGSTPSKPSSRELVKQIEAGTEEYRDAASELTKRIQIFEAWLNKLPGKVEATCSECDDPRESRVSFCLDLHRNGKAWALFSYLYDECMEEIIGARGLLRDADVETKARALRMFPNLLESSRSYQVRFVERARERASDFDEFAERLGIKGDG